MGGGLKDVMTTNTGRKATSHDSNFGESIKSREDSHAVNEVNASFAGACNLTAGGPYCRYPAFAEQCPDVSKSFGMARY